MSDTMVKEKNSIYQHLCGNGIGYNIFEYPEMENGNLFELSKSDKEKEFITRTCQLCKTGVFFSPWYGEMKITREIFETMIKNFRDNLLRYEPGPVLPMDVSHDPSQGAPGWIHDLYLEDAEDGRVKLMAVIEWNKFGIELISQKRYRYTSITFCQKWQDNESQKFHSWVLLGAALTTIPFITGMEPVTLSRNDNVSMGVNYMYEVNKKEEQTLADMADNKQVIANKNDEISTSIMNLEKKIQEKTVELSKKEIAITELTAKLDELNQKSLSYEKIINQMMLDNLEKDAISDADKISDKFKPEAKEAVRNFMTTIRKIDRIKDFDRGEFNITNEFVKIINSINFEGKALVGENGHSLASPEPMVFEVDEEVNGESSISTKFFNSLRDSNDINSKILKYAKEKNLSYTDAYAELTNNGVIK